MEETSERDYENPWYYQGAAFTSADIGDFFGFVYVITNVQSGRKYIGRKYFWQVKVSDSINETVLSPVYSFRTTELPEDSYYFVREISSNNIIFVADSTGTEVSLTSTNLNSFRPRKNNSINRLAFLRNIGSQIHLFSMRPDGSDVKQITNSIPVKSINDERVGFAWSNDGSYLLYPNLDI